MTWSHIDTTAATEVASGDITLAEPTGAAAGDLLVAYISYRSNAAFTLPTGWALCADQQSSGNTTANTTGSIASGLTAYIVRGASAPDYTFVRTGGDVAIGRVQAWRSDSGTPVLDVGRSVTRTTAGTNVALFNNTRNGALGFTTHYDNTLVLYAACCARNVTVSGYAIETDPNTTWTERADSGTTTGADAALAIASAIKPAAGAVNQPLAVASASAQHVCICAAFRDSSQTAVATPAWKSYALYEFSPPSTGSWQTVDLSAICEDIPAEHNTIAVQVYPTSSGTRTFGARKPGSSDTTTLSFSDNAQCHFFCELDGSEIELYTNLINNRFYLQGSTRLIHWLDTFGDLSAQVLIADTLTNIDVSAHVPSAAAYAVIRTQAAGSITVRIGPTGSTDSMHTVQLYGRNDQVIPLDSNKEFQYRGPTLGASQLQVVGWVANGHYHYLGSPTARRPSVINTWETFPDEADTQTPPLLMGNFRLGGTLQMGVRQKGESLTAANNHGGNTLHSPNTNGQWDFRGTSTSVDVTLAGGFIEPPFQPAWARGANQVISS